MIVLHDIFLTRIKNNLKDQIPKPGLNITLFLADGKPTYAVTQKPPQLTYKAQMRFVELGDNYQLPEEGSRYDNIVYCKHKK